MKKFLYINASTVDEAVSILQQYDGRAKIIAGGTDLLGQIKNRIHPVMPEVLINIKAIPSLEYLKEDEEGLNIGALTKLRHIAANPIVKKKYTALAQAAYAVASPQIRGMGTIGGNLCQDSRCWYYRASKNYFPCLRKRDAKKGAICYAAAGDHRYHSIFGAVNRCLAVNPNDTAPALVALKAKMKTTKRTVEAEDFFDVGPGRTTVLEADEILTEIQVPCPKPETRSVFLKYALRKVIDFPIVNCAIALISEKGVIKEPRICLNAVYNLPYRPAKSEKYLNNKSIDESVADEASQKTIEDAKPLRNNKYLVPIAKGLIERALLSCR
ncbi:MAG: FAD binding domain-containing protein [Thermodesulfobacteriota bacterium]|nr:FAD binding domain-containing protein [Thermodesulfobacteriota bacterium]